MDLDNKKVIDVLGVALRYKKPRIQASSTFPNFHLKDHNKFLFGYNSLIGIEVKVSRSDFKNGFNVTGCNYNFLLTPMKLISPSIVPRDVGLIEYNRYKFNCSLEEPTSNSKPFKISGVRVLKRPKFRKLPRFHVDHAISQIATRQNKLETTYQKILEGLTNPDLVYQKPLRVTTSR
jgi:hypothetical protein